MKRWLTDYSNPNSLGSRFRKSRMKRIASLISKILEEKEEAKILDVGGRLTYWMALEPKLAERCNIVSVNFEVEGNLDDLSDKFPGNFNHRKGDGCNLAEYSDNEFDLAHSNSVVEHVGGYENMKKFAAETRRVGKRYYVQTPYLWFPVEPHYLALFVHWLPASYRVRKLSTKGLGKTKKMKTYDEAASQVKHCELLDRTLFKHLFPDCEMFNEKVGPFTKSIIGVRG